MMDRIATSLRRAASVARAAVLVLGISLVVGPLRSSAQDGSSTGGPLTLTAAVERAMRTRPELREAEAGRRAAGARLGQARAGRIPRVTAGERVTNSNNPVFVFGSLLEQGRFGAENFGLDALNAPDPTTNFRSQIDVEVPLFDQRQTSTRVEQARLDTDAAGEDLALAEQRVRYEVIDAYFGAVVALAARDVAADAVATAEADAKRARDRFEAGLVVESDLLGVEVQLAEFRQQLIRAQGDVEIAYAALDAAVGASAPGPRELAGAFAPKAPAVASLADLVHTALATRPDARRLDLELRWSEAGVRRARGEYLPRVDAFASAGSSAEKLAGGSSDYSTGVTVTYNLFDAGRRARVDEAVAARDAAEARRDALSNRIRMEVARAYQNYAVARERLTVTEKAIAQAEETHRIVRNRYDAGITTITEVLRSQSALVRSRLNDLNARYAYAVGYAGVLLATGSLAEVSAFSQ